MQLKLHEKFEPFVLRLSRDFTQVPAEDFQNLRSKFSYWFLLIAAQCLKLGSREFELEHLKGMVGAQNYTSYADFRRRVLEVAEAEMKDKTSLAFDWSVSRKSGKSPQSLDFSFYPNKQVIADLKKKKHARPTLFDFDDHPHLVKLFELVISKKEVQRLAEDEDAEFLRWVAALIEKRKSQRKKAEPIVSHGSYCLKIIEGER